MKKMYTLLFTGLFVLLICSVSQAQKRTFLRFYNLTGHKFQKGHFAGATDSSIYVYKDSGKIEIPASTIGYIKTKRSLGHNILVSAIPAAVTFAIYGLATGEAKQTTESDITLGGILHDATTFTPAEGFQAGLIVGGVAGTATGTLITALTKRATFRINGSLEDWRSQKKMIDLLPSGK